MKLRKSMVASAAVAMVLGLLVVVPVQAQQVTLDSWVGKWLKGGEKNKGVLVDDSGTSKAVEKLPTYGFVQCYAAGQYTSTLVQQQNGTWNTVQFFAQVLGVDPNPLDYVAYALVPSGFVPELEALLVVLSVTGKEKGGELTKGKVRTVGGSVIYNTGAGSYFAAQETLKMKTIPEDKVPQEVKDACGADCIQCP